MKKTNIQRKKSLKNVVTRWAASSTFHGLPKIAKTSRLSLKLFWITIIIVLTIVCSYLIYVNIINYLDFDVITQIRKITEVPSLLPAITICNLNPFVTNYSKQFLEKIFVKYNLTNNSFNNHSNLEYKSNDLMKNLKFLKYLAVLNANNLPEEEKKLLGFSLDQMLISCTINGKECSPSDFLWRYDSFYGNCFTLNSGVTINGTRSDLVSSYHPGILSGIQIELLVGPEYYSDLITNTGAHIFIHNSSIIPRESEGFDLSTKTRTNIAIKRIFSNRIPQPYSNCINLNGSFNSLVYNILVNSKYLYRQRDCYDLCYQLNTVRKCNCYDTRLIKLNETYHKLNEPCLSAKEIECLLSTYNEYLDGKLNSECSQLCPFECNTYSFELFSSFTQYPTDNYAHMLILKHPNFKGYNQIRDVKKNVLAVNVYYESLEYSVVDELERTLFFDLISGIGGTFGLFLGTSFISFFEIFEIFLNIIFITLKKRILRN